MVRKIQNIRGDNLSARIALPDSNDEIRRLARTFNEMLERIEKSFIAQKEIVQDLSHELKTPLTIMRGQLEVALKKPRERAEYEAILRSNLEETARIRRIIDDLLMLARLDSRSTALEVKNVLLPGIIHSVLESTQMLAKEKNIAIAFEGPAEAVLEANEVHLHRLFTNLLENAVKYTPAGGQVLVSFVVEEKGFWVKVRDNGVGIDADRLPHVFDRFYRADNHRRSDSYGLGLSIVKSIVDAHQGQIRIESQPGVGTTFHIYLPKFHPMPFFKI
jgi:heavy metal sensor kinase